MKYIIIILMLIFTTPVLSMDIEEKLKSSKDMKTICAQRIAYNQKKINQFLNIPTKDRTSLDSMKLKHFKTELLSWISYCTSDR